MIQVFEIKDIGPSLNNFYAGMHFSERKKLKDAWYWMVIAAIGEYGIKPIPEGEYPITIDCRTMFGPNRRRYDWENSAATMKLIQDVLIKDGIIIEDNPKYIRGGQLWTVKGPRDATQVALRSGKHARRMT